MEHIVTILFVLATIFTGSFISLLLLCHHRKCHLNNLKCHRVNRNEHHEFSFRETEAEVAESLLDEKCQTVVSLCQHFSPPYIIAQHLPLLRHIIKVANSITEQSNKMLQKGSEQSELLDKETGSLVFTASLALASLEQRLLTMKEDAFEDTSEIVSFNSDFII